MIDLNIEKATRVKELGFEIFPTGEPDDKHFDYPSKSIFNLPKGSVITKAMSQRDPVKWGTFADIIRIYALVPQGVEEQEEHAIFIHKTGEEFSLYPGTVKIDTIKEYEGEWVFHVYHKGPN